MKRLDRALDVLMSLVVATGFIIAAFGLWFLAVWLVTNLAPPMPPMPSW